MQANRAPVELRAGGRRRLNARSLGCAGGTVVHLLVNIDVDDLDKGINFYRAGLGLVLKRRLFDDTVAELTGATAAVYLLQKVPGTPASGLVSVVRDYRRHWTPVHLDVVVNDLVAAVQRAQRAGGVVEGDPQTY